MALSSSSSLSDGWRSLFRCDRTVEGEGLPDGSSLGGRMAEVQPCHLWRLRARSRLCQIDGFHYPAVRGQIRVRGCLIGLLWMVGIPEDRDPRNCLAQSRIVRAGKPGLSRSRYGSAFQALSCDRHKANKKRPMYKHKPRVSGTVARKQCLKHVVKRSNTEMRLHTYLFLPVSHS